ncbi:uncharacterized protein UMAG_01132 [Mycosarcoma maydis]|uniref:Uncharacterized protein n=1 Tax=Mycosarcoma maydis TaxID=5270 RepID=A0A0D1CXY4_MYCMD|nr:uncharacterized protein UMAG_01132 [Ustilago maydis 521]KIS71228.1 hypothetical protein UMAG_01132 [Ustilago maydis 521]|eukprot:XP_011387083.1 hypothetical protein UMAG_01132 [Ustilago maydis 521]
MAVCFVMYAAVITNRELLIFTLNNKISYLFYPKCKSETQPETVVSSDLQYAMLSVIESYRCHIHDSSLTIPSDTHLERLSHTPVNSVCASQSLYSHSPRCTAHPTHYNLLHLYSPRHATSERQPSVLNQEQSAMRFLRGDPVTSGTSPKLLWYSDVLLLPMSTVDRDSSESLTTCSKFEL